MRSTPITFHFGEAAVTLLVGALEPLEGFVGLAPVGADLGNLKGPFILILLDELGQCSIRPLRFSCGMRGKRQPLIAPDAIRLLLHFGKRLFRFGLAKIDLA